MGVSLICLCLYKVNLGGRGNAGRGGMYGNYANVFVRSGIATRGNVHVVVFFFFLILFVVDGNGEEGRGGR